MSMRKTFFTLSVVQPRHNCPEGCGEGGGVSFSGDTQSCLDMLLCHCCRELHWGVGLREALRSLLSPTAL